MIGHICSQRSGGTDTAQAGKGGPGGTVLDSGGLRPSLSSSSSSPSSSTLVMINLLSLVITGSVEGVGGHNQTIRDCPDIHPDHRHLHRHRHRHRR